jgi:hypothetical protein
MDKRKAIEKKISDYEEELEEVLKMIIETGLNLNDIIDGLEEHLADMEELWSDEDLEYEVDEEGFYSLI